MKVVSLFLLGLFFSPCLLMGRDWFPARPTVLFNSGQIVLIQQWCPGDDTGIRVSMRCEYYPSRGRALRAVEGVSALPTCLDGLYESGGWTCVYDMDQLTDDSDIPPDRRIKTILRLRKNNVVTEFSSKSRKDCTDLAAHVALTKSLLCFVQVENPVSVEASLITPGKRRRLVCAYSQLKPVGDIWDFRNYRDFSVVFRDVSPGRLSLCFRYEGSLLSFRYDRLGIRKHVRAAGCGLKLTFPRGRRLYSVIGPDGRAVCELNLTGDTRRLTFKPVFRAEIKRTLLLSRRGVIGFSAGK